MLKQRPLPTRTTLNALLCLLVTLSLASTACSSEHRNGQSGEHSSMASSLNKKSEQAKQAASRELSADNEKNDKQVSPALITHKVLMKTSLGDVTLGLYGEAAPLSTENFLNYINDDFYAGTVFHRVIPGFMVQGGGFDSDYNKKPTAAPIKNEATNGLKNQLGSLAMARTNVVDSATSQFFINVVDNDFLNHQNKSPRGYGYAVFGTVLDGMSVVEAIVAKDTTIRGPHRNAPKDTVEILAMQLLGSE